MGLDKTAILIFTRNVHEEMREKQLFGKEQAKNIRLFQALNLQIRATVKATKIPFFVISTEDQKGDSFEKRYKNAFENIFAKGYDRVIAVGNDSPELSTQILLEIHEKLKRFDLIYGKSNAGGIYTFGLSKDGFKSFDFSEMSWQTSHLSSEFDKLEKSTENYHQLGPALIELNTASHVNDFLSQLLSSAKLRKLYGWLFQIYIESISLKLFIKKRNSLSPYLIPHRGPPVLA